jgi:hypothetical protein
MARRNVDLGHLEALALWQEQIPAKGLAGHGSSRSPTTSVNPSYKVATQKKYPQSYITVICAKYDVASLAHR